MRIRPSPRTVEAVATGREEARSAEIDDECFGRHATYVPPTSDVVFESFPDETIAVNLETGRYFSIDLVGAEVLELLMSGRELGATIEHVAVRYHTDPIVVELAVVDFARRSVAEGLLQPASDRPVAAAFPAPEAAEVPFSPPTLTVYSDMEDLLLLDPIHEVDATGWPARADAMDADRAGRHASA
jgi:hypothetical protein